MHSSSLNAEPASTTAPGHRHSRPFEPSGALAIRWLHPARRVSVLDVDQVTIGRSESSGIRLGSAQVSREHARVERREALLVIEDLGSRNGTFVDGRRCQHAVIGEGTVLRLGDWVGLLQRVRLGERDFGEFAPGLMCSQKLADALSVAMKSAQSELPIVVEGETGTGKERVARAIHAWSGRTGPFVAVNCATIADHLAEAELFGHARGAFTGASRENRGFFRAAQGGTLLLDEFGELPPAVQPKLLRVLELGELIPLGECHPVHVDVRLVVASQEPLTRAVAERRLRPDLFARLDGIKVELPPLRDRIEDAPALFLHFLAQASAGRAPTLQPELVERLCLYDWPFNVREVESLARRLMVLHRNAERLGSSQVVSHLREQPAVEPRERETVPAPGNPVSPSGEPEKGRARDQRDWAALGAALRACGGNVAKACAEVGISRARAYRLMHRSGGVDLGALRNGSKPDEDPGASEHPG